MTKIKSLWVWLFALQCQDAFISSPSSLSIRSSSLGAWAFGKFPSDFIVVESLCLDMNEKEEGPESTMFNKPEKESKEECHHNVLVTLLGERNIELLNLFNSSTIIPEEGYLRLDINEVLSKEARKQIHESIRVLYSDFESKTDTSSTNSSSFLVIPKVPASTSGEQGTKVRQKRGKGNKSRFTKRWDASVPDYTHFTIIKKDATTIDAIERLAKSCGLLPSRFGFAGNKDKNAITYQRASVWRLEKRDKLINLSKRNWAVRDVVDSQNPINLGALSGNLFCITLRPDESQELLVPSSEIIADFKSYKKRPLHLNLFGKQRFGDEFNGDFVSPQLGRWILLGDYRSAVIGMIILPASRVEQLWLGKQQISPLNWVNTAKSDDHNFFDFLEKKWDNYSKSILQLSREMSVSSEDDSWTEEYLCPRMDMISAFLKGRQFDISQNTPSVAKILLREISKEVTSTQIHNLDFQKIFAVLPRSLKQLYVNSVQSSTFNSFALEHEKTCYENGYAKVGDMVLVDFDMKPLDSWDCASRNIVLAGHRINCSSTRAQCQGEAFFHVAREEDDKFPCEAIIAPLVGKDTMLTERMMRFTNTSHLDVLRSGIHKEPLFRLTGAYRHVFTRARNLWVRNKVTNATNTNVLSGVNSSEWEFVDSNAQNIHTPKFTFYVEEMWKDGRMASFLDEVTTHTQSVKDLPMLVSENTSEKESCLDSVGSGDEEIQVSFCLPPSAYATTFLDHLLSSSKS